MEIKLFAFIFVLLYTGYCSPTDSQNFDVDGDYDDDNDAVEESKMPEKPLTITTPEMEFTKDLGETVTLPCAVNGQNYVHVWRKRGAILFQETVKMGATSNMEVLGDGSLEISNLHPQDAGEYECKAMATEQNFARIQHIVILKVPPQIELLIAKDNVTLLQKGDALILTCRANGYPKPVISWHKGSSRLDIQGEVLQIPNIKHHHAGTYKCLADNKIGEPAFSYINIKVEYKPVVTIEKESTSTEHNSETELECEVHSEPRAQVVWMKDGMNVEASDRIQLMTSERKHKLILKDVKESDYGIYTCLATNSLGTSKKNISLVANPVVHHFAKSQNDSNVILIWKVESKTNLSTPQLAYRKKGENDWKSIQSEVQLEVNLIGNALYEVKYTISKGLDPGDYELKFRSQNERGWSEFSNDVMSVEVFAKHGHHKSHKKGHKHGKERQVTPTPTLPTPEVPAEHQENQSVKESPSTANQTLDGCSITPNTVLVSIALLTLLQLRLATMRI